MDTPATESSAPGVTESQESIETVNPQEEFAKLIGKTFADDPLPEPQLEEGEEPVAPEPPPEKTYKVKVSGEEIEVPESELIKGYSRQADYTKKTEALAAERKQIEQVMQQINNERAQYQAQIDQMAQALGHALHEQSQINWNQLLENDPVEYLKQKQIYEDRQLALYKAQQEQQRYAEETQRQQAYQHQQRLASEQQELLAKLPDWQDEAKARAEKDAISRLLKASGFSDDEISTVSDHRAVLIARKAMLYDAMIEKAKASAKKVEGLPPKMEQPGTTVQTTDGRTKAMQALKRSGKTDDAAAVFARLL